MTLNEFFSLVPKAPVAFSGGTDSAFLLWAAKKCGCDVRAYYVKTPTRLDMPLRYPPYTPQKERWARRMLK